MTTYTNEGNDFGQFSNVNALVKTINECPFDLLVNGRPVFTRWGTPATAHSNGTLSVRVQAKSSPVKCDVVYVKADQTFTLAPA